MAAGDNSTGCLLQAEADERAAAEEAAAAAEQASSTSDESSYEGSIVEQQNGNLKVCTGLMTWQWTVTSHCHRADFHSLSSNSCASQCQTLSAIGATKSRQSLTSSFCP